MTSTPAGGPQQTAACVRRASRNCGQNCELGMQPEGSAGSRGEAAVATQHRSPSGGEWSVYASGDEKRAPSLLSCLAMASFSVEVRVQPGDCSPSRSVVSKTRTCAPGGEAHSKAGVEDGKGPRGRRRRQAAAAARGRRQSGGSAGRSSGIEPSCACDGNLESGGQGRENPDHPACMGTLHGAHVGGVVDAVRDVLRARLRRLVGKRPCARHAQPCWCPPAGCCDGAGCGLLHKSEARS